MYLPPWLYVWINDPRSLGLPGGLQGQQPGFKSLLTYFSIFLIWVQCALSQFPHLKTGLMIVPTSQVLLGGVDELKPVKYLVQELAHDIYLPLGGKFPEGRGWLAH